MKYDQVMGSAVSLCAKMSGGDAVGAVIANGSAFVVGSSGDVAETIAALECALAGMCVQYGLNASDAADGLRRNILELEMSKGEVH